MSKRGLRCLLRRTWWNRDRLECEETRRGVEDIGEPFEEQQPYFISPA